MVSIYCFSCHWINAITGILLFVCVFVFAVLLYSPKLGGWQWTSKACGNNCRLVQKGKTIPLSLWSIKRRNKCSFGEIIPPGEASYYFYLANPHVDWRCFDCHHGENKSVFLFTLGYPKQNRYIAGSIIFLHNLASQGTWAQFSSLKIKIQGKQIQFPAENCPDNISVDTALFLFDIFAGITVYSQFQITPQSEMYQKMLSFQTRTHTSVVEVIYILWDGFIFTLQMC